MKNLGKILFIVFLFPYSIFAGVTATVDSKSVELGEMLTYSLNLSGEEITRPKIYNLCGVDIISTSSSTNIQNINGNYTKSYTLSYTFMPKKSCKIEPIDVEIDGKKETTEAIDIIVSKVAASKDADFSLSLSSNKKEVYVGEPFELTLLFRQKNSAEAVDSKFIGPSLQGFWMKGESQPTRVQDGNFTVTKIVYTMSPQREGTLDITSAEMKIASRSHARDSWGGFIPQIKWKSYFSNELSIISKPLPEGVTLVGDFRIEAEILSTEVNANEAVNATVKVLGSGNLEDIKTFKPYIEGVSVFDEKIVVQGPELTQKIAFVADSDFTILPFSLKYFDLKSKEVKTISTRPVDIKVKNSKPKGELLIKREEPKKIDNNDNKTAEEEFNLVALVIAFIVGLFGGILMMLLKPSKFFKREKKFDIKDERMLLIKLLPYKDDEDVKKIVNILENNIYSSEKQEIDKKALKEIVKKYAIG